MKPILPDDDLPVAELIVSPPVVAALPVAPVKPAVPASAAPKAPPGMAPLEGLIHKAAARLNSPGAPASLPVITPGVPVVKPLPAEPLTTAPNPVVRPLTAEPIVATPVVAAAVPVAKAEPVAEPRRARSSRRDDPQPRRRPIRDDDADDDDRRSSRHRKANNAPLIALSVGGVLVLMLIIGGIFYFASGRSRNESRPLPDQVPVAQANNGNRNAPANNPVLAFDPPNMDANRNPVAEPQRQAPPRPEIPFVVPQPPPIPVIPFPQPPPFQMPRKQFKLDWVAYDDHGFQAQLPNKPNTRTSSVRLHDDNFIIPRTKGDIVVASTTPPAVEIQITTVDIPKGVTSDLKKMVSEPFYRVQNVTECKVAGQAGVEFTEPMGGRTTCTRAVQVGCRVFLFKFVSWDAFGEKEDIEEAKKRFYDSIRITFDRETPAPVDPKLRPRNPPRKLPPN